MGRLVAAVIALAWAAALALGLTLPAASPWRLLLFPLQVWLFTGLFITAHEAMHGLLAPGRPRLNHGLGRLFATLYGAMPYGRLRAAHARHHAQPSTPADPDFHERPREPWPLWLARFVGHYATWGQIAALALTYNALAHVAQVPEPRLIVGWIGPQALSTIQLFVVGTWLPHRTRGAFEGEGPTRARSVALPPWLSLLACFHFGYHFEHHRWPGVPWWRLPAARRRRLYASGPPCVASGPTSGVS